MTYLQKSDRRLTEMLSEPDCQADLSQFRADSDGILSHFWVKVSQFKVDWIIWVIFKLSKITVFSGGVWFIAEFSFLITLFIHLTFSVWLNIEPPDYSARDVTWNVWHEMDDMKCVTSWNMTCNNISEISEILKIPKSAYLCLRNWIRFHPAIIFSSNFLFSLVSG